MSSIVFPIEPQMKNAAVGDLQRALAALDYTIAAAETKNRRFGRTTRAAVVELQAGQNLPITGEVDQATAEAINGLLAERGVLEIEPEPVGDLPTPNPPPEDPLFSVEGEVVKPDGTPLRGHVVRAFDRALCDWRPLGPAGTTFEARTDEDGRYQIDYARSLLRERGKTRADLKVEVHDPSGDVKLAESPLILQALPRETVNFSIGPERYRGPDEFTRVQRALAPLLQSHDDDLSCLEVADVLILAREARLVSSNVAYYVKARRWAAEFGAPPALFYGLMRRGEPTRIDALLARPLARLWDKLEEANSHNLVDLPLDGATRTQLAQLQQAYLARPENPQARLLGTTALTREQRAEFTRRLTAGDLSGDAFWQGLESEEGFSAEAVADVRAAFELQSFTGGNTSLTVRLRGDLAVRAPREVAAFSVEQWRDTVLGGAAVELPDEVLPDGTAAERRAAYAQMLYRAAALRYPTASLRGQLARDPLPGQESLSRFFAENPDFEFRDERVLKFLREHPNALEGLPGTARDELLRMEQLFHLTLGGEEDQLATIEPLWSAGLRSAPQVAHLGRGNLMRRVGGALDAAAANRVFRKAVHVTSLALNVYLRFHPGLNRLSPAALRLPQPPNALSTDQALARSAITMPEWEQLFGSPDACACSQCESALSPAAYLVDTMDFLAKAVDADGNNALDELLARRPDLGFLRLTCENTETPLPHIDQVVEILEAIVASADGKTLSGADVFETTWDSDLLGAQPQYLRTAAYDKLRTSRYPFHDLPFNLWAEEGRRYLAQMGIGRHDLMQAMPAKPDVNTLQIATEALGMSGEERDLIRQPKTLPAELAPSWGVDLALGTLAAQLGSVEALIKQAHSDYDALLRLLNTRYINPERLISVSFGGTPCSLDGAVLVGEGGVALVDEPFRKLLDRLHRFLRLQRRLLCSEYDLDGLIHALGVADFNAAAFFPKLADVQALRHALGLPLPELGAWWADLLDTYAFEDDLPSQYEAIYQNEALFPDTHAGTGPDLRNAVFALREDRADLAITASTGAAGLSPWLAESDGAHAPLYTLQPDYAAYIQSALQLTADDLLLLVQELLPKDAVTGHVALNLANLSLLYRMASLMQALKIGVVDAMRLMAITGVTPLRTASTAAGPIESSRFYDRFTEIDAGAHSVEELAYLLLHDSAAAAVLAPATPDTDAWLQSVVPSFKGILAVNDERITPELKASLTQSLGSSLGVDPAVFDVLLFTHRTALGNELLAHVLVAANAGEVGLPAPHREFRAVFEQLHKFGLAWNGLALDLSFLPFVLDRGPGLGWTDIASLPLTPQTSARFAPWRRLVAAADLQASTFTLEQSLFGLLEDAAAATAAQADDPASFVLGDFLAQVSAATAWPLADVTYLVGANGFDLNLPAELRDEQALVKLERVFNLIRTTGVAAEQAHAWTIAELTYAETQSIKQALSLAFSPDRWLEILGSIQDELRTLKRDALLGHVLTTLGMEDSDAFYRHYLIDPDVSPLDRTSRIAMADSAVQLFAQRILLNLEAFKFGRPDAETWQWRKKYRVWEAARKVFLWPENWLEPELRDDKSIFFKELEEALLQEDVTAESAERIVHDYLIKLDEVSRLEILGLYKATSIVEGVDCSVLHVVGRTVEVPASYYYRRLEDGARWTPWERIQLDLGGDHLIPIVYNGKLHLFWPDFKITELEKPSSFEEKENVSAEIQALLMEITELQNEITAKEKETLAITSVGIIEENLRDEIDELKASLADAQSKLADLGYVDGVVYIPPNDEEYFQYEIELGMAWCTYSSNGTSAKLTSREKVIYKSNVGPDYHYFTGWVTKDNLLRIAVHTKHSSDPDVGYFYVDNTNGELHASSFESYSPQGEVLVSGGEQRFQSIDLTYFTDGEPCFELKVGSPPSFSVAASATRVSERAPSAERMVPVTDPQLTYVRTLLTSLTDGHGRFHYLHQRGLGGIEASPFFLSTDERCYFVEQQDRFVEEAAVFAALSPLARRRKSRKAGPTLSRERQNSAPAGEVHYQLDRLDIIDHALGHAANDSTLVEAGLANSIISPDGEPVVASGHELAAECGYQFTRFYHPYTGLFLRQASRHGISGLYSPDLTWEDEDSQNLYRQMMPLEKFSFESTYTPNTEWVHKPYPIQEIDFDDDSPYGKFNWELFFHVPLLIGTRLMQNQRYAEAREWFHRIFDPTATDGDGTERFWRIRPFYEEQLNNPLAALESLLTEGNPAYERQIEAWVRNPFQPYAIARLRITAYMQAVVMRYINCLLKEADELFRRDTREDINEARQLYLLAAEILGDRPQLLPAQEASSSTPNLLLKRFMFDWNGTLGGDPLDGLAFSLKAGLPGSFAIGPSARAASGPIAVDTSAAPASDVPTVSTHGGASSVDTLLLFCIPHNEVLYDLWDTVADRLFKIRHSMNFSGQVRQLALFAPPIDPKLLVRASAAGLSIESVLSGLFAPRSNYRFSFLLQKALELCDDVRSLGGAMLAALEKQDGAQIELLRSTHEIGLLESIRALKKKGIEEAEASLAGLIKSREAAELRATFFSTLERMSAGEQQSLDALDASRRAQKIAEYFEQRASIDSILPNVSTTTGVPPSVSVSFGGSNLGAEEQAHAAERRAAASAKTYESSRSGTMAGYARRLKDWKFQADIAKKEIEQLDQQMLAAEIRKQIAESDRESHEKQIAQAQEVDDFLKLKFSNQQLYSWMVSKLASVYFQAYQIAYQLAVQAQAAFQQELGPDEQAMFFIKQDNWDSLKKGLQAGDLLYLQLRQMEAAHLTANKRELEITKPVSLIQLDPEALLALRQTGACYIHIPEVLFDLDFAGHLFRRIKAVRLTIPGVAGPYTNISATLSLEESWTRREVPLDMSVPLEPDTTVLPQTAIATCTGVSDSGIFEFGFDDPRYLPFEGAGAISTWHLELPSALRPFDYDTIADVVLHISYTARAATDGGAYRDLVNSNLVSALNDWRKLAPNGTATPARLFSLRHEFPSEWNQLTHQVDGQPQSVTLSLGKQHFPRYLDFLWTSNGEGLEAHPISLSFSANLAAAILSPMGSQPPENEMPTLALSGLSDISNDAGADVVLTVEDGVLDAARWRDLYLLLPYEVIA